MGDALKPCPFCGGEARFDDMEMQVQCTTRSCTGQARMFDTAAQAITAWNTRARPIIPEPNFAAIGYGNPEEHN